MIKPKRTNWKKKAAREFKNHLPGIFLGAAISLTLIFIFPLLTWPTLLQNILLFIPQILTTIISSEEGEAGLILFLILTLIQFIFLGVILGYLASKAKEKLKGKLS